MTLDQELELFAAACEFAYPVPATMTRRRCNLYTAARLLEEVEQLDTAAVAPMDPLCVQCDQALDRLAAAARQFAGDETAAEFEAVAVGVVAEMCRMADMLARNN